MTDAEEPVTEPLFDVIATNIENRLRRVIATGLTRANAEAFVALAVARRGCDVEMFSVEHATYENEAAHEFSQRMQRDFDRYG